MGSVMAAVMLLAGPIYAATGLQRYRYAEIHMGVAVQMIVFAPSEEAARAGCRAAFDRLAAIEQIASDYRPTSELMQLVGQPPGTAVPVSDELWTLLQRSQALAARTAGAFDCTVGPLVQLWRAARRTHAKPTEAVLAEALSRSGYLNLLLDPETRTATLQVPRMRLDLGGIAKGYGADQALAALRDRGLTRALVQAGGEVVVGDAPPGLTGWRLELPSPPEQKPAVLALTNAAVASSGDTQQYVEFDGVRYSHIVDPHTGLGLTTRAMAVVVAADGMTADSLATAACVLGPEAGTALLAETDGVRGWVFTAE